MEQLTKAATTVKEASAAAKEALASAAVDVARALLIRQNADHEIREAQSRNESLREEIAMVSEKIFPLILTLLFLNICIYLNS